MTTHKVSVIGVLIAGVGVAVAILLPETRHFFGLRNDSESRATAIGVFNPGTNRGTQIGTQIINQLPSTLPSAPVPTKAARTVDYEQKEIQSNDGRFPYELEITVKTSQELSNPAFTFLFDKPFDLIYAKYADGSSISSYGGRGPGNMFWQLHVGEMFEPDMPMVFNVFAKQPIKMVRMERHK